MRRHAVRPFLLAALLAGACLARAEAPTAPAAEPAEPATKVDTPTTAPTGGPSPEERLWHAAREGDLATVKRLLAAGVPVDAKTEFDCTALYFAANANRPAVMKALIEAGADVNVSDNSYGYDAIGMAAWLGHTEAVEVLIGAGARTEDVIGSMFAAVSNGHAATVEAYVRKVEIPKPQLDAALGLAMQVGAAEVAAVLNKAGATAPEPDAQEEKQPADQQQAEQQQSEPERQTAFDASLDKPVRVTKPSNWPEFRGAGRTGIADGQHPPLTWDVESGRNVLWRTPVEGLGHSSPVVWGDRVFITTAVSPRTEQTIDDGGRGWIAAVEEDVKHRWQLHAYDLHSGEPLWKRTVKTGIPRSKRHWKASQANPSCATNGKLVVASFGSEGIHAFDFDGKPVWEKDLGVLNAGWYIDATFEWGYASSPILFDDRVIVQVDTHGQSFVVALDLKSGRELWRTLRDEVPSWGTPVVYRGKQRAELVLSASKAIVGYDPKTGKELWRIRGNSPITVSSPLGQDGLIVATGGYRTPKPIYVVKPGASGDVTPEENGSNDSVVWSTQTEGVYQVTPLLYRGILYVCRGNGVLTAYDPKTGEQFYRERLGGSYTASPVAADGRIYFTSEDGDVVVIDAGREFRVLARSELGAPTLATPAISNGRMVFRTLEGLIGVGFPPQTAAAR